MGFEPTTPFGASDFESGRHLLSPVFFGVFFGLLTPCAPWSLTPSSVTFGSRLHERDRHERHRHALVSLGERLEHGRDHEPAGVALELRGRQREHDAPPPRQDTRRAPAGRAGRLGEHLSVTFVFGRQ